MEIQTPVAQAYERFTAGNGNNLSPFYFVEDSPDRESYISRPENRPRTPNPYLRTPPQDARDVLGRRIAPDRPAQSNTLFTPHDVLMSANQNTSASRVVLQAAGTSSRQRSAGPISLLHCIEQQRSIVEESRERKNLEARLHAYFGRDFCQQHGIREIERDRVYHSSIPVDRVPATVHYILLCTAAGDPPFDQLQHQKVLPVTPDAFGTFSSETIVKITDLIYKAIRNKKHLLIACSSNNIFGARATEGIAVMTSVLVARKGGQLKTKTAEILDSLRRKFPDWNLHPPVELLDDFDYCIRWGPGSVGFESGTGQWKSFLLSIGRINKRKHQGNGMEYIGVDDFRYILGPRPRERVHLELSLPEPFNLSTLARAMLNWWEENKSDYVPPMFSRAKLLSLCQSEEISEVEEEYEDEEWSMYSDDEDRFQEAINNKRTTEGLVNWARRLPR